MESGNNRGVHSRLGNRDKRFDFIPDSGICLGYLVYSHESEHIAGESETLCAEIQFCHRKRAEYFKFG